MNNSKSMRLKTAILAIALVSQINTIASVMMADLAQQFPNASATAIQYVMQFGMIGSFPVMMSVGFLTRKFRIKPIIITGLAAIAIGGLIPILYHDSLIVLYVSAFVIGAGQGVMAPMLSTLVLKSFEGKAKDQLIGLNSTFATGGATVLTLMAGPVCLTGWVNVYFIYFLALPILVIAIMLLPAGEKPQSLPKEEKSKAPVHKFGFIQAILIAFMYAAYATFPLNVSMFVAAEGLGDAVAAGMASSIVTVTGAVMGLIFGRVIKVVKLYAGTLAAAFGLIGMCIACFANSLILIYIAAVMLGIYFGMALTGNNYVVGRFCTPEQIGPTLSIVMGFMTLGVVLSPIIVNNLTAVWGGDGSKGAFITSAAILGVMVVIQFIWGSYLTKVCPEENYAEN